MVAGPDPRPERHTGNRQWRNGAGAGGGWHLRHPVAVRCAGPAADAGAALQRPARGGASGADCRAGPAANRGPRPDQQPRQAAVVAGPRTCRAGSPRAAPGRLDCRPADRRLRPQRLQQLSQAWLRRRTPRVAGMACRSRRPYRAAAAGARAGEFLGVLHPGVAARLGLPPATQVRAGTTDGVAAFSGRGRARARAWRDLARLDAGAQTRFRPPGVLGGTWRLQPPPRPLLARRRRLEQRRRGAGAVFQHRGTARADALAQA